MNQVSQKQQKRQVIMYAVGGFVVGASAVAISLGLHNSFENDDKASPLLRGPEPSVGTSNLDTTNVKVPSSDLSKALPADTQTSSISSSESVGATSTVQTNQALASNSTPADKSMNFTFISLDENKQNTTSIPSPYPTSHEPTSIVDQSSMILTTYFPTFAPTTDRYFAANEPTVVSTHTAPSSNLFSARSQGVSGFRLKLYWEDGYFWQEKEEEKWWCMSCKNGDCEEDGMMYLRNCKKKKDLDATFVLISRGGGVYQYRVENTNLCLQKMGKSRAIKLKPCSANQSLQRFLGFQPNGDKFDLRPVNYDHRCLSNHHHPKADEVIYAETCIKAHRTDTGYWVAY